MAERAGARTAVNLAALKLRIRATSAFGGAPRRTPAPPSPPTLTPLPLPADNVAKLTNVMRLVASSKLKAVEDALSKGRTFGESIMEAVALKEDKAKTDSEVAAGVFCDDKKHLVVTLFTDRGLCGSVNSSLARSLRLELNAAAAASASVRLITVGDKGRAQIARDYSPIVARALDNYLEKDPTFALASSLASRIVGEKYDILTLVYNHYENQVKFVNTYKKIPQVGGRVGGRWWWLQVGGVCVLCGVCVALVVELPCASPPPSPSPTQLAGGALPQSLRGYEVEPDQNDETMCNLQEYCIASALYYAMLETVACETSQRVTAMGSASDAATEMVDRFKLIYNRCVCGGGAAGVWVCIPPANPLSSHRGAHTRLTPPPSPPPFSSARQAKVTTELAEIVSGAEASAQVGGRE